jgi:hypothetical protein
MPAPDYNWIADPDIITAAIQVLSGAVVVSSGALISVLVWIFNKTDAKVDRIATSLETLTLTVSTEIATIKATCKANHGE